MVFGNKVQMLCGENVMDMEKRAAFCELRENEEKERENRQSGSDPGSRGGGGEIFLLDSPAGSSLSLTKKTAKEEETSSHPSSSRALCVFFPSLFPASLARSGESGSVCGAAD